ncbi:MAG: hypothetical protein J5685_00330 [Clostridiales bacterium]|nr:hypothetical protein [Clostridiales bacterium]
MRGLIIKDLMSFRQRLVMVMVVTVFVIVLAVMFSISAASGNLRKMTVPGPDTTEQEAQVARDVYSYTFMMLMLLPMCAVGDTVRNLLHEDRQSGFTAVASVTPLTIRQRIMSKIICFCGLYLAGAVLSILICSAVSLFTDMVAFGQLFSIVIIGLSVCLIYTFLQFDLGIILNGSEVYSETFSLLIILLAVLGMNTKNIIALIKAGDDFPNVIFEQARSVSALITDRSYLFIITACIIGVISYFVTVAVATKKREVI